MSGTAFRPPIVLGWLPALLLPLMLAGTLPGCSSASKSAKQGATPLSATDESLFFGDTLEKNYDPNVIMKRAESFFEKENYPEAIIEYQHFLDLHRVHVLAPYARYKLAQSHFKMFRTVDRDPAPIQNALEAYRKLLRAFPGSQYEDEARAKIAECHHLLAERHLMVGKFYQGREAYLAAVHRFQQVVNDYPDDPVAAEALYHLAVAYHDLGADDFAGETLVALARQFPNHPSAGQGRKLYAELNGSASDLPVVVAAGPKNPALPVAQPGLNAHLGVNGASAINGSNGLNGSLGLNGHVGATGHTGLNGHGGALVTPASATVAGPPAPVSASRSGGAALRNPSPSAISPLTDITLCHLGEW
ncbi:MAG: outer membrane protein assembly factor BamD, partial [Nitrospirales bacterium]